MQFLAGIRNRQSECRRRHIENRPFQPHHAVFRNCERIGYGRSLDLHRAALRRGIGRARIIPGHEGFQKLVRQRYAILGDLRSYRHSILY